MDTDLALGPARSTEQLESELTRVKESFHEFQIQLEDRWWKRIRGGNGSNDYEANGLDLDSIKKVSEELRTWIVAGMLKRISDLRSETIYGDGVGFKNIRGATKAITSPNNVEKLFSVPALMEISRAHDTDGNIVILVHKRTKEIVRFFVTDMGDPYVDGMDPERAWFVKREWTVYPPGKPEGETRTLYYPTDTCPPELAAKSYINEGANARVKVDKDYTAVLWPVNKQGGWVLGVPNLIASIQWAERYTNYLKNQDRHAEALAAIAWEFSADTTDTAKRMAAALATPSESATTVSVGGKLSPMTGASDVSFDNGAALAGQAAAAGGVTLDSVLAKRADAAATSLDPGVKNMAEAVRASATIYLKRIARLLGAPNIEIVWPDLESESPFRESQMIVAAWGTGNYSPEEIRAALAQRSRIPIAEGSKSPEGVLIPNNAKTLELTAKAKASGALAEDGGDDDDDEKVNKRGKDALGVGKLTDNNDGNEGRNKGEK
jgi:hypothetical protein